MLPFVANALGRNGAAIPSGYNETHAPTATHHRPARDRVAGGDRLFARHGAAAACRAISHGRGNRAWAAIRLSGVCRHGRGAAVGPRRLGFGAGLAKYAAKEIDRRAPQPEPERDVGGQPSTRELSDNLATGKEFASGDGVSPKLRAEIETAVAELEAKRAAQQLEIVAFGTISSGKSSLLNALAGRDVFRTNVVGGTTVSRSEIPWPAGDRVVLVDTPGLAEVRGESGPPNRPPPPRTPTWSCSSSTDHSRPTNRDLLAALTAMEKRIVVCLNKEDWYDDHQRDGLLKQLVEQVSPAVKAADVVAVRSRPVARERVHVLPDGTEEEESVTEPPDIRPLAERMMSIVDRDGRELLLANLLLQSRGLVDEAKAARARRPRPASRRADQQIHVGGRRRYGDQSDSAFRTSPAARAITVKMVLDLAAVYQQKIDADTVVTLLGQLGKNLIAMVGAPRPRRRWRPASLRC